MRSDGSVIEPDMSAGFCPDHKAAMVLFLDRVYGIEDQNFLLHLLEVGFLPDLRAAASLDTVSHVTPQQLVPSTHFYADFGILHGWKCDKCVHFPTLSGITAGECCVIQPIFDLFPGPV